MKYSKYDLYLSDFGPMILILKLDPDMVKMYKQTKSEVPSLCGSELWPEQTDTQTQTRHEIPCRIREW